MHLISFGCILFYLFIDLEGFTGFHHIRLYNENVLNKCQTLG